MPWWRPSSTVLATTRSPARRRCWPRCSTKWSDQLATGRGQSWGLLLAPGASAGKDQAALVAIDQAATAAGGKVRRMDFPYRMAGRTVPDKAPVLIDAVVKEATSFAGEIRLRPGRLFTGGRSMGGRICSIAVAEGLPAAGLVLVSYPLHPPGKPERLRTDHFGLLDVPCLFVSGTRDAFAAPAELEQAVALIPGKVTLDWVAGGDHALRGRDAQVASTVAEWLVSEVVR